MICEVPDEGMSFGAVPDLFEGLFEEVTEGDGGVVVVAACDHSTVREDGAADIRVLAGSDLIQVERRAEANGFEDGVHFDLGRFDGAMDTEVTAHTEELGDFMGVVLELEELGADGSFLSCGAAEADQFAECMEGDLKVAAFTVAFVSCLRHAIDGDADSSAASGEGSHVLGADTISVGMYAGVWSKFQCSHDDGHHIAVERGFAPDV